MWCCSRRVAGFCSHLVQAAEIPECASGGGLPSRLKFSIADIRFGTDIVFEIRDPGSLVSAKFYAAVVFETGDPDLISGKLYAAAAEPGRDFDRLTAIYPAGSFSNCLHHIATRR